ncbi:hypothetical protein HanRHA438_Chr15g0721161 [Helianthus annuus]|nr:hypothetical protein HanRHA438_Chr15g0721161 [Helianthus annuus]
MDESSAAGAAYRGRGQGQGQGRGRGRGRGCGRGQEDEVVPDFTETGRFLRDIPRGTVACRVLGKLRETVLDAPRTIDFQFLTDIGATGRVRELMPANSPWGRLFYAIAERAHREITLEFLSTFSFTDTRDGGFQHFLTTEAVAFTICGKTQRMTLPRFAVALGLYSQEDSRSRAFFDALVSTSTDVLWPYWRTIGFGEFAKPSQRSPKARATDLYDPLHRYLHRCIAVTIAGRHDSREWVTQNDLFFLHDLLTGGRANLAYKLAAYLAEYAFKRPSSHISCGAFVTRLAKGFFRLLSPQVASDMTLTRQLDRVGKDTTLSMGLAREVEGGQLVWAYGVGEGPCGEGGDEEGDEGEGGEGEGDGGDREGVAHTVDRSQVAAEELRGDRPYVRRSVRQRVMPPPGVEERLVQVESDVAAVRGDLAAVRRDLAAVREDVRWMVEAIVAIHSAAPLPP